VLPPLLIGLPLLAGGRGSARVPGRLPDLLAAPRGIDESGYRFADAIRL
jgi:hypothetical protein